MLPRLGEELEGIGAAEDEVHASAQGEVLEEGDELRRVAAWFVDDEDAGEIGLEALVDGDDHAAAGDGEAGGEAWWGVSGVEGDGRAGADKGVGGEYLS